MDALTFERENEKMDDKEKRRIPQSSAVAQSYFAVMSFETNEFATNNFAAYAFSFVILRKIRNRVWYQFCFCATCPSDLFRLTEFNRKFQLFDCRLDEIAST